MTVLLQEINTISLCDLIFHFSRINSYWRKNAKTIIKKTYNVKIKTKNYN